MNRLDEIKACRSLNWGINDSDVDYLITEVERLQREIALFKDQYGQLSEAAQAGEKERDELRAKLAEAEKKRIVTILMLRSLSSRSDDCED